MAASRASRGARGPKAPPAGGLRPLGLPRPLTVEVDEHRQPRRVTRNPGSSRARSFEVEQVQEVWRIAEEWWCDTPLERTYYRVTIDGGRVLTLFCDELSQSEPNSRGGAAGAAWFEQHY